MFERIIWIVGIFAAAAGLVYALACIKENIDTSRAKEKATVVKAQAEEAARTITVPRPIPPTGPEQAQRFEATSVGQFYAGFDNHKREILIIKDTQTGHQYLGITGVGITELWTEQYRDGKTTKTRTVEE